MLLGMKLNGWLTTLADCCVTLGPLGLALANHGYAKPALVIGGIASLAIAFRNMWMTPPGQASQPVDSPKAN